MDNRKDPHPQHPSITNLSFTVTFTQDAAALFLKRAKNVKLADKDCKRLTTEIVQSVVNKIANGADKHALSFLRGTTTSVEQRSAYLRVPTALALSTTSTLPSYDMITPGENQSRRVYKTPWADLEPRTRHKRVSLAVKRLRDDFLPFAREALNMRDDHGEPMDNNAVLRVVLEYGSLRAHTQNRLVGITFPE